MISIPALLLVFAISLDQTWGGVQDGGSPVPTQCTSYTSEPELSGCRLFYYFDLSKDGLVTWDEFNAGMSHMGSPLVKRWDFVKTVAEKTGLCPTKVHGLFFVLTNVRDRSDQKHLTLVNKVFTWLALPDIMTYSMDLCATLSLSTFQNTWTMINMKLPECRGAGGKGTPGDDGGEPDDGDDDSDDDDK